MSGARCVNENNAFENPEKDFDSKQFLVKFYIYGIWKYEYYNQLS